MSSRKVILIVGLPGCGKTHYTQEKDFEFEGYHVIDDPSVQMSQEELLDAIEHYPLLVIADPLLCFEHNREIAAELFEEREATWIFFANDPETCINNIRFRGDDRNVSREFIKVLSREYTIPTGAEVLPVYRCE